jgi:signal transduction histidine kinase/CheY-like chemotaxis protein
MRIPETISSISKLLLQNTFVAVVYFGLGLFGLLFKVSGSAFSPVEPSSGLAVAAILLSGNKLLPGIFAGSLFVHAWDFNFSQNLIWLYLIDAMGDCFTPWLAGFLVSKAKVFPDPLDTAGKIGNFMSLSGPASSLASAVISTYLLRYFEIIQSGDTLFAFSINWLGQILGIVIFTPLFLIVLGAPQSNWRRRVKTVGLPVIASFTLVVALFFYQTAVDRRNQTEREIDRSITFAHAIKNRIEQHFYTLQTLNNYLQGHPTVDSKDFVNLARTALSHSEEISALRWLDISGQQNNYKLITTLGDKLYNNTGNNEENFLPLETRKQLLSNLESGENKFIVLEGNVILLAVTVSDAVVTNGRKSGILIAVLTVKKILDEVLNSSKASHFDLSISVAPKSGLTEKLIFSNTGFKERQPYYIYPVTVVGQTWRISFFHAGQAPANRLCPAFWIMVTGMSFTAFLGLTLLYHTGRTFRTEAIIDDRTHKLIQTKTSAETANKAKGQFLAKISHELRTPLNGISGFVQLLEKNRSLNQEAKQQLAIIKQCATDLLTLINEILDTSAIENEHFKIQRSDFDFCSMFEDTMQICKIKADEKGIKLITQNNCPIKTLYGDEKRIRQIVINLVDNAIKYTRHGNVTVNSAYENGILNISVSDTGDGIADADLDRIFLPFVQVHDGESALEGIGLGLFIIKELVNLMEGNLTISSQPGVGSVFNVVLPLAATDGVAATKPLPIQKNEIIRKPERVLVVDDSEINLLFLSGLLEHIGCYVNTAANGYQALSLLERNHYDLALIDINMPLMNGIELVKKIRALKIDLKIAVVSAYADDEKISEATAAGIDAYLTKPVDESRLIELIHSGERYPLSQQKG